MLANSLRTHDMITNHCASDRQPELKQITSYGHRSCELVTDVEGMLERMVRERTGGRVRHVKVQFGGSYVTLRGVANSYHEVQLAVAGLFEAMCAMRLDRPEDIELDIDVATMKEGDMRSESGLLPR